MKTLVIEDEKKLNSFITKALSQHEFTVDSGENLDDLFSFLQTDQYQILILDRLLQGVDSINYLKKIKSLQPNIRIIFLSALDEVDDKVQGLTLGADDYVAKPFHVSELIARMRVILNRDQSKQETTSTLNYKDLCVQLNNQSVKRKNKRIELTPKEYKLLVKLLRNPDIIFSKYQLLNEVWDLQHFPESNVVEVSINHLRKKIDSEHNTKLIHSKRGVGYWLGSKNL